MAGWEWNEELGREINTDSPVAGPALEPPAVLNDWMRRFANLVMGTTLDAQEWASTRANQLWATIYNMYMGNNQHGFTVGKFPIIGDVTIIPGLNGDGFGPFIVEGIPFRIKLGGFPVGSDPTTDVPSKIGAASDICIYGLFGNEPDNPEPVPLLRMVYDVTRVKAQGMVESALFDFPSITYAGVTYDQVREVYVKEALKEPLEGSPELLGQPIWKGSVDAAAVLWMVEHLRVPVWSSTDNAEVLVPLLDIVLPLINSIGKSSDLTTQP